MTNGFLLPQTQIKNFKNIKHTAENNVEKIAIIPIHGRNNFV